MKKRMMCLVLLSAVLAGQSAFAQTHYSYDESHILLSVEADENVNASDRAAFVIFSEQQSNSEEIVYFNFANVVGAGKQFVYDFTGDRYGVYTLQLTLTDYSGNTEVVENAFYYNSPESIADCVKTFRALTTEAEFQKAYQLYGEEKRIINISEITEAIGSNAIQRFLMLREIYEKNLGGLSFESCADVLTCVKGAILIDALERGVQNTPELFEKYRASLGTICGAEADAAGVRALMSKLGSKITDENTLYTALRYASVFSPVVNGTEADFIKVINSYHEEIGADLSYAAQKGVSLAQAVKYLDFRSDPVECMYNFGRKFEAAVDSAVASSGGSGSNKVSGGGGGGGGGMLMAPAASGEQQISSGAKPSDTLIQQTVPSAIFTDIAEVPWAEKYITQGYQKGILSGVGDGRFAPNDNVTREQFVKMLVEALNLSVVVGTDITFEDVEEDSWYAPYIRSAYSLDITKGVTDKEFGTGRFISRQEIVTLLYRAYWIDSGAVTFRDEKSIETYAKDAVMAYAGAGIVTGYEDNTFRPGDFASRAEAAVMIGRLTDYIKGEK